MTGYVTVIGGVTGNTSPWPPSSGIVTVPSSLNTGAPLLGTVQDYLNSVSFSADSGTISLINYDAVTSVTAAFTGTSTGGIYEVTNTDSVGTTTPGSVAVAVTVPSGYNTVVIEAPGSVSVSGNGAVASTYVLGSATNAIVSTNGSGGGINTIYDLGGNDTIYAAGSNQATLAGGVDRYKVLNGSSTVVAAGNATVQAGVPNGYYGSIDFINDSTAQATVFGEAGVVTAYGGAAGGLYYGGTSGNNSLVGGAGMVTLVGGGSGDTLEAGFASDGTTSVASALNNYMYAGVGNETLIASAGTHNNLIALGVGSDFVTTDGSGNQYFFGSSGTATIDGSTASGATNIYFMGGNVASNSGGYDVITNYSSINSHLYAINGNVIDSISAYTGSNYPQGGALVTLSDGTQVVLVGVNPSNLSGTGTSVLTY